MKNKSAIADWRLRFYFELIMRHKNFIVQLILNIIIVLLSAVAHIYLTGVLFGKGTLLMSCFTVETVGCIAVAFTRVSREIKLVVLCILIGAYFGGAVGVTSWIKAMRGFMDSY